MTEADEASHLRRQLGEALERIKVLEGQVQALSETKEIRVFTPGEALDRIKQLDAEVERLKAERR